ncbi:amidohydrolase [Roseibium sp. CAU 1637]|uniref:Amidohydrolase n=1 Tax=Roseibium limicola TaxID=2816037 RepID=A0A939EJW1_9HYPH|nr:amidohydrolase [Roseibium limicola]MBO0343767.1 amidohydrolase [Roseibium limicola]
MPLSSANLSALVALRHDLHQHPEVSGQEEQTAQRIRAFLTTLTPNRLVGQLGGHGLAAVFEGSAPGPTILLRCELDALPIQEKSDVAHRSTISGKGHLCGHDGHMAILAAVAMTLAERRPAKGRTVLLFQPAEEDGSGAAKVLSDEAFALLAPDLALSLHNCPGLPIGRAALKSGPVNCASRGLKIEFTGKTAHASQPETGLSPMPAVSALMPILSGCSKGTQADPDFRLVTITHAQLGEPAFGIAPGDGQVWATLRTLTDDQMEALCQEAEAAARKQAEISNLEVSFSYHDVFHHCENAPEATAVLARAMDACGVNWDSTGLPWRPSEDFGRFRRLCPSAMLFLGAGVSCPALHNPDYDFPDELIPLGAEIFLNALRELLG